MGYRSRFRRAWLAAVLALTLVFALVGQALAWNNSYYLSGSGACGPNEWCVAWFYVDGGSDAQDWVSIDYYRTCYGVQQYALNWSGTVYRGQNARSFWNSAGCYSSYAYIWTYDPLASGSFLGPYT